MVLGSWSRDPKQRPNIKYLIKLTPLFHKKSYLYCVHVQGFRLLGLVKSFSLVIVTLKKFFKNFNGLKKIFQKFLWI